MRICLFMPRLRPNSLGWQVYQDLASAITARGHELDLVTVGSNGPDESRHGVHLRHAPAWRRIGQYLAPGLRTRLLLPDAVALWRYLRDHGHEIEILHVESAYPDGAAAAVAVLASRWRGKLVLKPMGDDVLVAAHASYGFRRFALPRILVAWTLRRADVIRCSSPLVLQQVMDIGTRALTRVIPICVTRQTIEAADESADARSIRKRRARAAFDAEKGASGGAVIVTLGRLHPFKGIDVLIEALALLPRARLFVAGPSLQIKPLGDYAEHLARMADEVGVHARVDFLGPVDPAVSIDLLAAADVVAIPSHVESHNKVAIEAAAVGTPFVVTETTGIAASVPQEGVGVVVPPADARALARALRKVLDGSWQHRPAEAAQFARRYAPERIAAELIDLYETALA